MSKLGKVAQFIANSLFLAMFATFVLQILMRYVFNAPLSWTLEVCLILYIWTVFWGGSFCVKERDHVSFNVLYECISLKGKRILLIASKLFLLAVLVYALPATYEFVSFMAIDSTWTLEIPFDLVYSIFVVFMVSVIVRSAVHVFHLLSSRWQDYL